MSAEEEFRAGELNDEFEENMKLVNRAVSVNDDIQSDLEGFTTLRNEIDDVLDERMQVSASRELATASQETGDAVRRSRYVLVVLLLSGLLVGGAAAYLIGRGIGRSLRRLVEGTRILGRGSLDHRIEVNSRDEMQDLAAAFNFMAERRQRSEQAVRHLNRVLEDRVEERTEKLSRALEDLGGKERNLRESEERYRAVVERATEGIYLFDPETGRIKESNTAYQRLLGYTAEEILEMTIYDVVAHERESIDARIQSTISDGANTFGERRHRRKDGALVDVEFGTIVISHANQNVVCAIIHDITERKRAERGERERVRPLQPQPLRGEPGRHAHRGPGRDHPRRQPLAGGAARLPDGDDAGRKHLRPPARPGGLQARAGTGLSPGLPGPDAPR